MTTTVQVSDDGGASWRDIDYTDFSIEVGLSDIQPLPTASIVSRTRQQVSPNQPFRILQNGTPIFRGNTESGGTIDQNGSMRLDARHRHDALFTERIDISNEDGTTANVVVLDALANATNGDTDDLDFQAVDIALDEYVVEDRTVLNVLLDIMDRTGYVFWLDPATTEITVQTRGGRGTWKSLDRTDGIGIESYDDGNVETVINDVSVTATRGEGVTATATDATSIAEYGKRSKSVNVAYAATLSEAQEVADSLLQPEPLAEGDVVVPRTVGDVTEPLVNYTIDVTDASKGIDVTGLLVEKQLIEQSRATLESGEGKGQPISDRNRTARSDQDKTEAGFVMGNERIGTDAVDSDQLVDTAVLESKLADLSVTTSKLQDNAVINGKLDDLSVSETKIQDDSIATPKLQAEAVTANEIEADTITAAEIAAGTITALEVATDTLTANEIAAGTITALEIASDTITANEIDANTITAGEIAAGTLTANEIDALDLTAGDLSVDGNGLTIEFDLDSGGQIEPEQMSIYPVEATGVESTLGLNATANEWDFGFIRNLQPVDDDTGRVGSSADAYSSMYAYEFIDASTGTALDGGDPTADLAAGDRPPEHCRACSSDGSEQGVRINELTKTLWDIATHQQEQLDAAHDRIDSLEQRLSTLEDNA